MKMAEKYCSIRKFWKLDEQPKRQIWFENETRFWNYKMKTAEAKTDKPSKLLVCQTFLITPINMEEKSRKNRLRDWRNQKYIAF